MKFISILLVLSQLSAIAARHEQPAAHHSNDKKNEAIAKFVNEKFSQMIKDKFNEIQKEYGHKGHKDMREKALSRIVNAKKKAPMSKEAVEENRKLAGDNWTGSSDPKPNTGYSVSHYSTSGRDCTGQIKFSEGDLYGQPAAKETLHKSDLNLCEWQEDDGTYAMIEGIECNEDGDHYKEHLKISIFDDHDCKNLNRTISTYETFPKCENYNDKEIETKAIITQCSTNPTPMNNFKGLYFFVYPPGTCGTKSFPISYASVILEDFCYPTNEMVGDMFLTGAKYKYNPTTNMMDYNVYFKDIPASTGQDILHHLGYNGGDPCDGSKFKFFESSFEFLETIHECTLLETESFLSTSLQYVNGDGKTTTKHSGVGAVTKFTSG